MLTLLMSILVFVPATSHVDYGQSFAEQPVTPHFASLDEVYRQLAIRRECQIARLGEYAAKGVFPLNIDFPGKLVPYFVDHRGTHCAVGELVRLDGHTGIVADIVATNNHVRINDVNSGPLFDWIVASGLTKAECALIQPSYSRIEDYRHRQEWQDEITRLQTHFAKVEQTLRSQEDKSLGEVIRARVNEELLKPVPDPTYTPTSFLKSLTQSKEPNVRIAAAYALARVSPDLAPRSERIDVLQASLEDEVPEVRFWAAVALERIGSASAGGSVDLHRQTLPIFLDIVGNGPAQLREAALIQLATHTPECINSGCQLRIVPEVRRVMVEACSDQNSKVQEIAKRMLQSWRWQRIAYESNRMMRQYLVDTHKMEAAAAETVLLNRGVITRDLSIERFQKQLADPDIGSVQVRIPMRDESPMRTAESADQAITIVSDFQRDIYKKYLDEFAEQIASWHIQAYDSRHEGLYFIVSVLRDEREMGSRMDYVVPKSTMLQESNRNPHSWLEAKQRNSGDVLSQSHALFFNPQENLYVVLGQRAKSDISAFKQTCDMFAQLMTFYALLLVDREVSAVSNNFIWSGRFATARYHKPRFYELGGGGASRAGGGGWDFLTVTMTCNQESGELKLATEPLDYPIVQRPEDELTPPWRIEELKLLGWKKLDGIEFFGEQLLPPEYHETAKLFHAGDKRGASERAYRQWRTETSLPSPYLLLSILHEEAGDREEALKYIDRALDNEHYNPRTLADVARWEASLGLDDAARQHAEAALNLWSDMPAAKEVLARLGSSHE
jgi:hypothetical protein